nr:ATP-binding cassette domain-containing protein [Candidatus Sodalis endolongispinus]
MAQRIGSPRQALALGIGTVFQHPMLVPTLTLAENLALGDPWWRRPARRHYAAEVARLGARLGVTVDATVEVSALSLGERQQAEILRALLRGSRVLLLDEPTALLTPHDAERLGLLMRRLVAQGLAVVFITHKLNEALAWGDRISVLRLGRKVGEIPPARLRALSPAAARRDVLDWMFHRAGEGESRAAQATTLSDIGTPPSAQGTSAPSPDKDGSPSTPASPEWNADNDRPPSGPGAPARSPDNDGSSSAPGAPARSPDNDRPSPGRFGSTPLLVAQRLSVADARVALRDIDFSVAGGEILGIAGIDGNGQTQLDEAQAGQRRLSAGCIWLAGQALQNYSLRERRRRGLSYVTDDRLGEGTVATLTVAENLLLKQIGAPPFWRGGIRRPVRIDAFARRRIRAFDIRPPEAQTPVGTLSGGNVQKILLARELNHRARAVIFAKPTYSLDLHNSLAIRERIRQSAAQGVAVVLISTDLDELLALSHRVAVLRRGQIAGMVVNDAHARRRIGALISGETP